MSDMRRHFSDIYALFQGDIAGEAGISLIMIGNYTVTGWHCMMIRPYHGASALGAL